MAATPSFNEKHSGAIRIWHWLSMLVITCSLLTILVNSTVLKPKRPPLAPGGGKPDIAAIQADPQFAALKPLRNTVWQWHKYFGFALATLFMYRIALEFFQPGDEKFTGKIKSARNYLKLPGADLATGKHYLRVKLLYTAFYISLSFLVITGLTLAFFEDAENLKPVKGAIKEFHEFNMYMVLIFITLHVAGVILAELGKYKGVVSGMINGGKQP